MTEMMRDSRVDVNARTTRVRGGLRGDLGGMLITHVSLPPQDGSTPLALAKEFNEAAVVAVLEKDPRVTR